jgi:hypothetical protein
VPVVPGAVYRPLLLTVPPVADHVTEVFELPLTVAVNCCVALGAIVAATGLIETDTGGGVTVTVALANLVESAALVAFTVTEVLEVTVGAVNRPELDTVPAVAVHVTEVLEEPVTVAVNCLVAPEATVADVGLTETLTGVTTVRACT